MTKESLLADRRLIQGYLARLPVEMEEKPPEMWMRSAAKQTGVAVSDLSDVRNKELYRYVLGQVALIRGLVSSQVSPGTQDPREIARRTDEIIMEASVTMAKRFEPRGENISHRFVPLETAVAAHPDDLQIEKGVTIGSTVCNLLKVRHPLTSQWANIPLPIHEKVWHKGGSSRAITDVLAGSPKSMLAAELPPRDFDVVIPKGDTNAYAAAIDIGAEPDGIETYPGDKIDFSQFCMGRDTNQNQTLLGNDGLHYSDDAWRAAQTGEVRIVGQYVPNKAIYNTDSMKISGMVLPKPRGLSRLVKVVVEGKATTFEHLPVNANFDMGIYLLFLGKRWSTKENFGELTGRTHFLVEQMGQMRPGERNLKQVLERAHQRYPFFDFDSEINDMVAVARWKAKKLAKQIDRESTWVFGLPSDMRLKRWPGDDQPEMVSLSGFEHRGESEEDFRRWWEKFVQRCNARKVAYLATETNPAARIFMRKESEWDDLMPESLDIE